MLSQLGVSVGCNVVFDSTEYHPEQIIISGESYESSDIFSCISSQWDDCNICPFFQDFTFSSDSNAVSSQELPDLNDYENDDQESFEDYTASFEILSQRDDFFQDSPSPTPQESQYSQESMDSSPPCSFDNDDNESPDTLVSQISDLSLEPPLTSDTYDDSGDMDSQPFSGEVYCEEDDAITKMLEGPSSIPSIDFIKNLVSDTTEYHYFNNALMSNWAGPEHWKFKQTKNKRKFNELHLYINYLLIIIYM